MFETLHATLARVDVPTTPGPRKLEVRQWWGDQLVSARSFEDAEEVTIGTGVGTRWSLLGRSMGFVDPRWERLLELTPPVISDVAVDWRADFVVDGFDGAVPVVTVERGRHVVRVPRDTAVLARIGGAELDGPQLCAAGRAHVDVDQLVIPVVDDAQLAVAVGATVLVVHRAPVAARVRGRFLTDPGALGLTALVAAATLIATSSIHAFPVSHHEVTLVEADHSGMLAMLQTPPPVPQPPAPSTDDRPRSGGRASGSEGSAGARTAPARTRSGGGRMDPTMVGALADADAFASVGRGPAALAQGVGGLIGSVGTAYGEGGLGERGRGLGGGGDVDVIGSMGLNGPRTGGPTGSPFGGRRVSVEPKPEDTAISTATAYPAHLVDEGIKKRIAQFRYCYERELPRHPDMAGKVTLSFTIARDGTVSTARVRQSDLPSEAVGRCMTERLLRVSFPAPNDGIVMVAYPFVFSSQ